MIPAQNHKHVLKKWWRVVAAAAAIVVAVFGVGLFMQHDGKEVHVETAAVLQYTSDAAETNIDAMADYIMCDDYELYAYMADE